MILHHPCIAPKTWGVLWFLQVLYQTTEMQRTPVSMQEPTALSHVYSWGWLVTWNLQTLGRAQYLCKNEYAIGTNSTMEEIEFYGNWNKQSLTLLHPKVNETVLILCYQRPGLIVFVMLLTRFANILRSKFSMPGYLSHANKSCPVFCFN